MKVIYYTAASLDGYIADAQHSLAWLFQFGDGDESGFPEFIRDVGTMAMGSGTYEWLLRNHVFEDPDAPKPWPHEMPTWVFTTRALREVPGADVRFVRGDVAPVFEAMCEAAPGKNVWLAGGGDLVAQFHARGLLDEIVLTLAPVFLGGGAPVFTGPLVTPPLEVATVKPHASGLVEMRMVVRRPDQA